MHFSALTLPLMAMVAAVQGASVKVYEDAKCTKLIQTINYNPADYYQCVNFNSNFAQAVIMSTDMAAKGFNAWDRQFCAGNQAGGAPAQLGKCIAASDFGLAYFRAAHISPRNEAKQAGVGAI